LQSSFELGSFLEITLARITPQIGGKCERHRKKKKPQRLKVPKQYWGHKRNFSIIKAAHAKLGHDKENPKDLSFS
jgi:hypothetical protein